MMQYKSYRIVDGKPRWVIVDENGKIIHKEPSKEDLKGLDKHIEERQHIRGCYNETNTCDRCRVYFYGKALREVNKEGKRTGKWLCNGCYNKDYDNNVRKNNPNSHNNIVKSLANRRIGNLDPNSEHAKGDLFQELTCRWRSTVSTIHVEDLNKKLDNYTTPIDHSRDSELGIIQTKGCLYSSEYRRWSQSFKSECDQIAKDFEFDILVLYCANKYGSVIERIYKIPVEEVIKRLGITIYSDILRGPHWYEQYRIKDEEIIKKVNEIWKKIIDEK